MFLNSAPEYYVQPQIPFLMRRVFIGLSTLLLLNEVVAQTTIPYSGFFVNTFFNAGGTISMTVTYWPGDSISGFVDFTEYPGNAPLCAAGNFTGFRSADSLYHSFTSFDTDPGCGFDWGVPIFLFSRVHYGLDSISGIYQADPTPTLEGVGYYGLSRVLTTNVDQQRAGHLSMRIFPNPTDGIVHVDMNELSGHGALLSVVDVTGRTVIEARPIGHVALLILDLGHEEAGSYLVQLQLLDGTRIVERMLKL